VGRAEYGNVQFQFWDLGGSGDLSRLWANYYSETHLVLFVIDGTVLEACNQAINFFGKK
jgi:ADP-ribosylation factor related protein 1